MRDEAVLVLSLSTITTTIAE